VRTITLATIVAITLSSRLSKQAAALEAIDPAIVSSHLQEMQDQEALP
jgi:hypothetical protein